MDIILVKIEIINRYMEIKMNILKKILNILFKYTEKRSAIKNDLLNKLK